MFDEWMFITLTEGECKPGEGEGESVDYHCPTNLVTTFYQHQITLLSLNWDELATNL